MDVNRVTVIVVSYNSRPYLSACLTSIAQQHEIPTEVTVVDNASTDGSAVLMTADFPSAQLVVNQKNRGFAAAVNQGLALATGEFIMLLNPDAALLPGALAQLMGFLESHPCAAGVGPRQWLDEKCTWQWSIVPSPPHWRLLLSRLPVMQRMDLVRHQLAERWALNRTIWRNEEPVQTPYLSGACLLLRRTTLETAGGLDEGYFLFYEDVDLCDRLRSAGWELYAVPSAGVVHTGLGSVRFLPNGGERYLLDSGKHYLAQHGDPLTRALWAVLRLRRMRQSVSQDRPAERPESTGTSLTLRWRPVPGTTAYWVELAPDPTFLYAAAKQVAQPACTVPGELVAVSRGKHFFWRITPIGRLGKLERFCAPQRMEI